MKKYFISLTFALFIPLSVMSQLSNPALYKEYVKDISNANNSLEYVSERFLLSVIESLNTGISASSLDAQIKDCKTLIKLMERMKEGTAAAQNDKLLASQIIDIYKDIDSINLQMQMALNTFIKTAEQMKLANCFNEQGNCGFLEKENILTESLYAMASATGLIPFKSSLAYYLSDTTLYKGEKLDEILGQKARLRSFEMDGTRVYFYDALFPEDEFTFNWRGGRNESGGKAFLNGIGRLEYIKDGNMVVLYEGNIDNGRLMDMASLTYTDFKNPADLGWRSNDVFRFYAFFYNQPVGSLTINSDLGEYQGEHKNFIPHGKGFLKTGTNYGCSGEFKDGLPYNVTCTDLSVQIDVYSTNAKTESSRPKEYKIIPGVQQ